jgi:hypothetical protein
MLGFVAIEKASAARILEDGGETASSGSLTDLPASYFRRHDQLL